MSDSVRPCGLEPIKQETTFGDQEFTAIVSKGMYFYCFSAIPA